MNYSFTWYQVTYKSIPCSLGDYPRLQWAISSEGNIKLLGQHIKPFKLDTLCSTVSLIIINFKQVKDGYDWCIIFY